MPPLTNKVAVVAGASRGAGRGIAVALGEAGATVYVAGRTRRGGPKPPDNASGTIDDTADEVTARGGKGIPVQTDFTDAAQVAALFDRVWEEQGRLDVLANAVYGGHDLLGDTTFEEWSAAAARPLWEQDPVAQWRYMMDAGPYAYWLASCRAAGLMARSGGGLIAGVTDGLLGDTPDAVLEGREFSGYMGMPLWDLSHQAINRLLSNLASEFKAHNIAVLSLMPGFMQTERVLASMTSEELKQTWRFDLSESPEYIGRAVAALAADPNAIAKTGRIHFVADLAREYNFTAPDGSQPPRFKP